MPKNILFFIKTLVLVSIFTSNLNAEELSIIPQKKPILDKIIKEKKITQGMIKPRPKPENEYTEQILSKKVTKPKIKPSDKIKNEQTKKVEKLTPDTSKTKVAEVVFLVPKNNNDKINDPLI